MTPLATAIALAPLAGPLLMFSALSSWYLPSWACARWCSSSMVLVSAGFLCMCTLDDRTRRIWTCYGRC